MSSSLSIWPGRVRWGRRADVGDTGNGGRDTGCGVSESPSAFSTHPGDFTGTPRAPERAGLAITGKSGVGCAKWQGIVGPCDGKLTQADAPACKVSRELWQIRLTARAPRAVARGASGSARPDRKSTRLNSSH